MLRLTASIGSNAPSAIRKSILDATRIPITSHWSCASMVERGRAVCNGP
jgi:hypothetical protein